MNRTSLRVASADGAEAGLDLFLPDGEVRQALLWLPALGVGLGPNVRFASALAETGIAVAVLEWRGLGTSSVRAGRDRDWNYATLLDDDIPAAIRAARAALPDAAWAIGGHSLGGQLALITAARAPDAWPRVLFVASGQPRWDGFGGRRAWAVRVFLHAVPAITALYGHFPGTRLRFAGREARGLMRDWAMTARRGDYTLAPFGDRLDAALRDYPGEVLALRFTEDWLAPEATLLRMQAATPAARWVTQVLGADDVAPGRADHFGWLRHPAAVASRVRDGWPDVQIELG